VTSKVIVVGKGSNSATYLVDEKDAREALTLLRRDTCGMTDAELASYKLQVYDGDLPFMFGYMNETALRLNAYEDRDNVDLGDITEQEWIDSYYNQFVYEDSHSSARVEIADVYQWADEKADIVKDLQKKNARNDISPNVKEGLEKFGVIVS
jgi:hypothetical protein